MKKILVAIPAFNCQDQIIRVIKEISTISNEHLVEFLIIDNQSTDNTINNAITAIKESSAVNIKIVINCQNYGLGGTHKIAFKHCIDSNFDGVIILHGDDQGSIQDILPSINCGDIYKYNCLLGARFMQGSKLIGYSYLRILGNYFFNFIHTIVCNKKVHDMGSGLNYYDVATLKSINFFNMPDDLTFNNYFLLRILQEKMHLKFFPIAWKEVDQISNVKFLKQSKLIIYYLYLFVVSKENFKIANMSEYLPEHYAFKAIKIH